MLEPSILGECSLFDNATDASTMPGVPIRPLCETDSLVRWLEIPVEPHRHDHDFRNSRAVLDKGT